MPSTIIGCGGRTYIFGPHTTAWVTRICTLLGVEECIDGGAPGADEGFHQFALAHGMDSVRFFANWIRYERQAGPRRNAKQLAYLRWVCSCENITPYVIGLPGGRGTENMVVQAKRYGIPVLTPTIDDLQNLAHLPTTREEVFNANFCHR